ncbi:MAG: acyl--CoA ligase [Clostridium sp.]|nr:acyl--CoA ligase [Clostridium sp.]
MEDIINERKRQKLNRPITGIIQNDRVWEQWYDQSIFSLEFPQMNQKDYLLNCIGNEKSRIIINNRGMRRITVNEFDKMILEYEKAFATMGLKKGDVICTIGLTTPEMYVIKYSATSLGLILCNLNIFDVGIDDDGKNRLYRQMENIDPKMIFILDIFEEKLFSIINDVQFAQAIKVSMPLGYSAPKYNPERFVIALKVMKNFLSGKVINNKISLNDFLLLGKNIKVENIEELYEERLPCNISFTSGTTGINKAVLLSHDANNALAFQQKIGEFGFKERTKNLALVPPFLAFWDADIVHAVLCQGGENIIELELNYDKIPQYFTKHKANMGIWSQYLWSSLLLLPEKDLREVSKHLQHVIVGGERCEINDAEIFYNRTGIVQMAGFGASEVNTTFSITHPNCIKIGTAGIPLPFNNVKIVNDSFQDVTYNIAGKLFITGPCLMNGYYKRDDLTKQALYIDETGVTWYNTGDYAVIDDDGCLTVLDRYIEPIQITHAEKINLLDIVEIIKKDRNVKNCKLTFHKGKLVLHLSVDNFTGLSEKDAIKSIMYNIKSNLSEKQLPHIIRITNELPRTAVGKVDYKLLENIGEKLCNDHNYSNKLFVLKENQPYDYNDENVK